MPRQLELQNEMLRAVIAPEEGGRLASLSSLASGVEFLFQSQCPFVPVEPGANRSFLQGACAGIEECLPTVSRCEVDGETIPDHGDFWQLAWDVLPPPHANTLCISADGFSRPLRFTKNISLRGACLRIDYQIENIGNAPVSFHYAAHPLLAMEAGDRILLPAAVTELTVHASRLDRLGRAGDRVPWPVFIPAAGKEPIDCSRVLPLAAETAEMLYSGRLKDGWCGLYRTQQRQGIAVRFDPKMLPYLGLWICCGGWPDSGVEPKQYAFAPEPTTAPCGSLQEAQSRGLAVPLLPQRGFQFHIEFCIAPRGLTLDEFAGFCRAERISQHASHRDA